MEHYRTDEGAVFFGSGVPAFFSDRPSIYLDRVTKILYVNKGNGITWAAQVADAAMLAQISLGLGLGALALLDTVPTVRGGTGLASEAVKFKAHNNAVALPILNTTHTSLILTTEALDTHNCYASGIFTPSVAGWYLLDFHFHFEPLTAGKQVIANIQKNNTGVDGQCVFNGIVGTGDFNSGGSALLYANGTTDLFFCTVWHNEGSTINIRGQSYLTTFAGILQL